MPFAIDYCLTDDLPSDKNGDALHDEATFTVEQFKTEPEALDRARVLLRENDQAFAAGRAKLAYGSVRLFETVRRPSKYYGGRLETIEVRQAHLSDVDEVPDWETLDDPDGDDG